MTYVEIVVVSVTGPGVYVVEAVATIISEDSVFTQEFAIGS